MPVAKEYPPDVVEVFVRRTMLGFRYNGRGAEGRVIYESPRSFRSGLFLRKEVRRRWPGVRIVNE
jgi:hypothetical protein